MVQIANNRGFCTSMSHYDPVLDSYKEPSRPVQEPVNDGNGLRVTIPPISQIPSQSNPLAPHQLSDSNVTTNSSVSVLPLLRTSTKAAAFTPTTEMVIEMAKNREQIVADKETGAGSPETEQQEPRPTISISKNEADVNSKTSRVVYNVPQKVEPEPQPRRKPKKKPSNQVATSKSARHLKKADGEPFWRKDIQYDFLQALFDDPTKAFTNSFPHCEILASCNEPKLTFCDLYIRTLAESGKCSKILRERLLRNREMGKSVAKVCLLVNSGRLNTTINFVPEMRSLMRTYHSIPSLQADPVYGGSKPLQDTPRIKSILKAVTEVDPPLRSLDHVLQYPPAKKPNVTPTQLVFFMSNTFKPIRFQHDPSDRAVEHPAVTAFLGEGNRFMEFFMNSRIHPANRAKRFLWLMYTYIETSFTDEELQLNPFHPGIINPIELLSDSQIDDFDKDTDYEIQYSEKMYNTRLKCIAEEEHNTQPKRGNKAKRVADDYADDSFDMPSPDLHRDETDVGHLVKKQKKDILETNGFNHESSFVDEVDIAQYALGDDLIDAADGPVSSYYPQIPIKDLADITLANIDTYPRVPRSYMSAASQYNIIAKSTPYIHQAREDYGLTKLDFDTRKLILKEWLRKHFEYRRNSGNRLLGIEWERIRNDLISGAETYVSRQVAEIVGTQKNLQKDNDSVNKDGEMVTRDSEYVPTYDFEEIGQTAEYICKAVAYYQQKYATQAAKKSIDGIKIKFDLEKETMDIDG